MKRSLPSFSGHDAVQRNPLPDGVDYSLPTLELDTDDWRDCFAAAPSRILPAGVVFTYIGPQHGIYSIEKGRIRFFSVSRRGTEKTFCILGPGATFGEANLVDPTPTRWLATPLVDTTVRFIDITTARKLVETRPALMWSVMDSFVKRLKMVGKQIEDQCFRTVSSRIACIILARAEAANTDQPVAPCCADRPAPSTGSPAPVAEGTGPDPIALTHDEIAHFIGSNRVTVTRALRAMKRDGIIDYDRNLRSVSIVDGQALEELAADEL